MVISWLWKFLKGQLTTFELIQGTPGQQGGAVVSAAVSQHRSWVHFRGQGLGVCMFSLCLRGFSLGLLAFRPTLQKQACEVN